MLKRVNINWMVLLFLLDHLVVQIVLPLAVDLRYALPIGQFIEREWIYLGWALRGIIALAWTGSFVTLGVYNPRQVTHWIDEVQRVVMGHAVAALLMAGMLYLVKQEMPRLAFGYFFVLSLAVLLIYQRHLASVAESAGAGGHGPGAGVDCGGGDRGTQCGGGVDLEAVAGAAAIGLSRR